MNQTNWKEFLPEFREKTAAFYAGEMSKGDYKGFSGLYGSYAQRSQDASMLRLRMPAGRVTKEKLKFVADAIRTYDIDCVHFTTCETIQLHNLKEQTVVELLEKALDAGIITMGGGGDFPRNVMCSPLSGVEEECFDVRPYAEAAGEYLMGFITAEKMPHKLKVCFSNSPANLPHATFRDLGFAARPDGTFDVYSAGGLGNNARFGVQVGEAVDPTQILYYIKAMWLTFRAYGNYQNRGKARTRYMQEALGGAEAYAAAYKEKLEEVYASGEDLTLHVEPQPITKKGCVHPGISSENGNCPPAGSASGKENPTKSFRRLLSQKQEGLYAVLWHPIGGQPDPEMLVSLSDTIAEMEDVELRLAPDETAYIINLTGPEAEKVLDVTAGGAETLFERSVSCIGASICQVGLRDSQELLRECVAAVREAEIADGALPQIHISGCPSSCGTHQTGSLGFRGAVKSVDKKPQPAFVLYDGGCERQGEEAFGEELGTMLQSDIPPFLVKLGRTVAASGLAYEDWRRENPEGVREAAAEFL